MTVSSARAMLERPVFGDLGMIEAVRYLSLWEELEDVRKQKLKKPAKCPCCKGRGYESCYECGQNRVCHSCNGTRSFDSIKEYEDAQWGYDPSSEALLKDRIIQLRELL